MTRPKGSLLQGGSQGARAVREVAFHLTSTQGWLASTTLAAQGAGDQMSDARLQYGFLMLANLGGFAFVFAMNPFPEPTGFFLPPLVPTLIALALQLTSLAYAGGAGLALVRLTGDEPRRPILPAVLFAIGSMGPIGFYLLGVAATAMDLSRAVGG